MKKINYINTTDLCPTPPATSHQGPALPILTEVCEQGKPVPTSGYGNRALFATLLPFLCMCGDGMKGFSDRNPGQQTRNDPGREKTPKDLDRMTKAQAKRDRKVGRKPV